MSRARALPAAVLIVALAAACSSGRTSRIDASPEAQNPDLRVAQQAALSASDLRDFKADTHTAQSELRPALRRQFAKCTGTRTTIFDAAPGSHTVESPDFIKGRENEQQVTSSVEIYPKAADVDGAWKSITGAKTQACLKQLFQALYGTADAAKEGIKYGPVQISEFELGVGDRSIGYSMTRDATRQAARIVITVDVIYVVRDRAGMRFQFFNYGPTPDRAAEKKLVKKVYDRVGDKAS